MAFTAANLKSATRAAAVALALGASCLVAAPAFAQNGAPGFRLDMQDNDGGRGFVHDRGSDRNAGWDHHSGQRCLSNREVTRGIRGYGYDRVEITRELRNDRVDLQAVRGNGLYSMRVDKCSGQVDRLQRIGRAFEDRGRGPSIDRPREGRPHDGGPRNERDYNGGGYNDGGFGFQFNFGN